MITAGLHVGHDANAAIVIDGRLAICVEAERISGVKHVPGKNAAVAALTAALNVLGIRPEQLDGVCVADEAGIFMGLEAKHGEALTRLTHNSPHVMLLDAEGLGQGNAPLYVCCHGMAHAASAIRMSGYSDAAILYYDGYGSCSAGFGLNWRGGALTLVEGTMNRLMVGHRYSQFGYFFDGIKKRMPSGDEEGRIVIADILDFAGKIMGAHAYGVAAESDVGDLMEWFSHGDVDVYHAAFMPPPINRDPLPGLRPDNLYNRLHMGCLPEGEQRSLDVLAAMQEAFSRVVMAAVDDLMSRSGQERLIVTGGCGLNIVTNERIARMPQVRELFIPPNCDDRGISAGAAILLHAALSGQPMADPATWTPESRSPYQGLSMVADAPAPQGIHGADLDLSDADNLGRFARALLDERIIGLLQGRSEIGPRALGHRSILASPLRGEMKDIINRKIKQREWWRPFAPVVRSMDADRYFNLSRHDPYMLTGGEVRPEYRDRLAAITHVDGTARVQCLPDRDANPVLWDLLGAFEAVSGIGVLLNTSFNAGGKPLVNLTSDAFALLRDTGLDSFWMDGRAYWKSDSLWG
ncbi:hypothetical protein A6A04_18865 [Paramagnetospirillum marisnigri]|uniref:Carbamoyl transferase n=1 Tax=Paramagnetospirillum marisnigri TaxID=1285242 RepID=A0A178MM28_9PROT|nr:carbamoyltransferase C-terminal domain-containing protein [Paramagnetospirillum marisnigri]OAN49800.1 hypothetical protein A6A04_18865 [Paramagnetospirillum marisnigri]